MWNPFHQQALMARMRMAVLGVPQGAQTGVMAGFAPNPAYRQSYFQPQRGGQVGGMQGLGLGVNLLSSTQMYWLHLRAIWFVNSISQAMSIPPMTLLQAPQGLPVGGVNGRSLVAQLAAAALVGDDYNPVTNGPTQGYDESKFTAAYNYVYTNIADWYSDAYPPVGG